MRSANLVADSSRGLGVAITPSMMTKERPRMDISLHLFDGAGSTDRADRTDRDQRRRQQQIDDAFAELVLTYHQRMLHTALQLLRDEHHALEATETAFSRAYQWLSGTGASMPPQIWMYRATVKASLERLQLAEKEQRGCAGLLNSRPTAGTEDQQSGTWNQATPPRTAEPPATAPLASAGGMIDRAIAELHPRRRTIFVLKHFEDLTFDTISDILEITPICAKSLYHGALVELKLKLGTKITAMNAAVN
jgi:DNA-directed RNA polymerase specialized sigma24 family protein